MSKSIFNPTDNTEIIARIEKLSPESQAQWGKMNVSQMLSHCQAPIAVALGDVQLKRGLFGLLFGGIAKKKLFSEKPWGQGMPTAPTFIRWGKDFDFETEKGKLKAMVGRFLSLGPAGLTQLPHPFFGKLTVEEWDALQVRHLDHHLSQFGA